MFLHLSVILSTEGVWQKPPGQTAPSPGETTPGQTPSKQAPHGQTPPKQRLSLADTPAL